MSAASISDVQKFFNLDSAGTRIQKMAVINGALVPQGARTLSEFGQEWKALSESEKDELRAGVTS